MSFSSTAVGLWTDTAAKKSESIVIVAIGYGSLLVLGGGMENSLSTDSSPVSPLTRVTSVDTIPMEALSASLNKYGEVNLEYMGGLVDMEQDAIY